MRIIVEVRGGTVVAVYTNGNPIHLAVDVLDWDNVDSDNEIGISERDAEYYRQLDVDKESMTVVY